MSSAYEHKNINFNIQNSVLENFINFKPVVLERKLIKAAGKQEKEMKNLAQKRIKAKKEISSNSLNIPNSFTDNEYSHSIDSKAKSLNIDGISIKSSVFLEDKVFMPYKDQRVISSSKSFN